MFDITLNIYIYDKVILENCGLIGFIPDSYKNEK